MVDSRKAAVFGDVTSKTNISSSKKSNNGVKSKSKSKTNAKAYGKMFKPAENNGSSYNYGQSAQPESLTQRLCCDKSETEGTSITSKFQIITQGSTASESEGDYENSSLESISESCSESESDGDLSTTTGSCLTYSSSQSSILVPKSVSSKKQEVKRSTKQIDKEPHRQANSKKLKMKKTTNQIDKERRNNEERRLRSIHLVACRHLKNGDLKVTQQKFEEILSSLVEEYGDNHCRVGSALHNLGIVYLRAGNLNDAKEAIKDAIKIRTAKLGYKHPKVADSLVELGIVLIHLQKFERAVGYLNRALSIREKELDEATDEGNKKEIIRIQLQIAKIQNNIGCAFFEVGDTEEAKDSFECALEIQQRIIKNDKDSSAPGQLVMSSTICNLGLVHQETSEWECASDRFNYALKVQRNVLDDTNTLVLSAMEHLAYAYMNYGNYDESLKVYNEIVEIKKSVHENEDYSYIDIGDMDVADAMKDLVFCQMKLFKYEDAIETLRDIIHILEFNYDDDDERLIKTRDLLESAQYDLHKHPGFMEMVARNLTVLGFRNPCNSDVLCRCALSIESSEFLPCKPSRPAVQAKLSGHKISYA